MEGGRKVGKEDMSKGRVTGMGKGEIGEGRKEGTTKRRL